MKYLFFDIECSNCFNKIGKICEFGYVLTDEEFNILEQDDIPMSPGRGKENDFHLKGRKHEKDLELAYEYNYYKSLPEFPHFYERIKKLMTGEDTICFAYSMDNDILHMYNSCRRYKLKKFDYTCYDVQLFAKKYLEAKNITSLKNACLSIVGPNKTIQLVEHLSRDDAKMTMMIFEAICYMEHISSKDYLEQNKNYSVRSSDSINDYFKRMEERKEKQKAFEYFDSIKLSEEEASKEEYVGRRYEVSAKLKKSPELLKTIIDYVNSKNGVIIDKVSLGEYFIVLDEENKEELIKRVGEHFTGQYILYKDIEPKKE